MLDVPSGLPVALSVAVLLVTDSAGLVTIAGGPGTVNDSTAPYDVPEAFETMAQNQYVVPVVSPFAVIE